jgi:hypothetical protein
MKRIVALVLICVLLAGCADVRTYTFKKDRVDQRIAGNRGYFHGTPPPAPVMDEVPKRTLIGIDIEIPVLPYEKVELPPEEEVIISEETRIERRAPARPVGGNTVTMGGAEEKTNFQPRETLSSSAPVVEEVEETEEEWIK